MIGKSSPASRLSTCLAGRARPARNSKSCLRTCKLLLPSQRYIIPRPVCLRENALRRVHVESRSTRRVSPARSSFQSPLAVNNKAGPSIFRFQPLIHPIPSLGLVLKKVVKVSSTSVCRLFGNSAQPEVSGRCDAFWELRSIRGMRVLGRDGVSCRSCNGHGNALQLLNSIELQARR